jgi:2-dehydropantoate 2-reductase
MEKHIAVIGVGAIGSTIGAYLTRAGRDLTLIDQWPEHVEVMKRSGIRVSAPNEDFTVRVRALHLCETCNLQEKFDMAFLAVKSYDTLWATHFIAPYLKPTGFVLPAQNGMNDEVVAGVVGFNRTVGCVITFGAGVYDPGRVVRTEPVELDAFCIGELNGLVTPRAREVAELLLPVGPNHMTTNIWGMRWSKMVINCMGNALAGLIGPSGVDEAYQEVAGIVRMMAGGEVVRVAQAMGVSVEPVFGIEASRFAEATTKSAIRSLQETWKTATSERNLSAEQTRRIGQPGRPSLLQDVMKGRRPEADYLNGYVVRCGREVGVATPVNEAIVDIMKQVERGELKPAPSNLGRFEPLLRKACLLSR